MKLGIVSNMSGCQWAGSEEVWYLASLKALEQGYRVRAFLHPDLCGSLPVANFQSKGGEIKRWMPIPIARFRALKEKLAPTFPVAEFNGMDALLVSLGSLPALCYVPGLVSALLSTQTPILLFPQFNSDHLPISPVEREVVRAVIKKSHACIFVSQRNLEESRRQFAVDLSGGIVIGNPIRNITENPLHWPESDPVRFACVARLETAWKGQDLLLDILSRDPWQMRNWHLDLFGQGPDEEYLKQLVSFLGLEKRVSFCGHVDNLEHIWSIRHMLLLPSHGEGLPLALLEAMMYGRPSVVTDVGGNKEVLREGESGFIAEGATAFSFGGAMERAWENRDQWEAMGNAAHRVARKVSDNDATNRLLELCKSIAKKTY